MKISKLIELLRKNRNNHGDLNVWSFDMDDDVEYKLEQKHVSVDEITYFDPDITFEECCKDCKLENSSSEHGLYYQSKEDCFESLPCDKKETVLLIRGVE